MTSENVATCVSQDPAALKRAEEAAATALMTADKTRTRWKGKIIIPSSLVNIMYLQTLAKWIEYETLRMFFFHIIHFNCKLIYYVAGIRSETATEVKENMKKRRVM